VNADYYHTEYRNIQKTVQKEFPPGSGVLNRITSNAAAATIDGVEVEATAIVTAQIRLVASGAYTKPNYTQFFDGANPLTGFPGYDESFQRFLGVSKWTYNLSGVYTQPVSFGQIQAQVDWSWRSNVDLSPADSPGTLRGAVPGAGTPDAFRIQPSYGLLNASATVTFDQYKLDLKVYVKNLTKQKYDSFLIGLVNSGVGTTSATPGDPRTYGVDLTWRF
jgi:iron complex outermembrane receptor protein